MFSIIHYILIIEGPGVTINPLTRLVLTCMRQKRAKEKKTVHRQHSACLRLSVCTMPTRYLTSDEAQVLTMLVLQHFRPKLGVLLHVLGGLRSVLFRD